MPKAKLAFILLILLVVMPSLLSGSAFRLVPKANAATRTFILFANYYGWNYSQPSGSNPTITVTQGDTISFSLVSSDSSTHLFLIDFDGNGVINDCSGGQDKCSGNIPPTGSSSIAPFTVTAGQGQYSYYCLYHSPPPYRMMIGRLVVMPKPDFSLSPNPSSIGPINTRFNGTSRIAVSPIGGFSGTVMLSASPSSGLNATISPTSIPGSSGTATLTVNSTIVGSYSVTVTGTGSSGTHYVTLPVTVAKPDFKIALSPSSITVAPGSMGSAVVTLTSLSGFSGTVSLASTVSSPGPQITFSLPSVTVSTNGPTNSTMSISAMSSGAYSTPVSTGNYNVNVTGTSGSIAHSVILALTVGSTSGSGTLPTTAIIGGGIAAALVVAAVIGFSLRRRSRTKTQ